MIVAALDASEAGCDVLAFSRDRDNDEDREKAIEEGIAAAKTARLAVVGAAAIPTLEGWILALMKTSRTEAMSPGVPKPN